MVNNSEHDSQQQKGISSSSAFRAIVMIPSQRESYILLIYIIPDFLGPTLGTASRAGDLGRIDLGRHIGSSAS